MQLTTKTQLKADVEDFLLLFEQQGKFFRTVFNQFYWGKKVKWQDYCSIDCLYQNGYNFGTKYASSLFLDAKNKAKLHQEEYCFRQKQYQEKLKELNKKKKKLVNSLLLIKNKKLYLKTKTHLYWINRKIEKINSKLNKNKGVTFGTKDLQRKLSLKQTTKENWLRARNNFIYALGCSEKKAGNHNIQYFKEKDEYFLKIELERSFEKNKEGKIEAKDKKYLTVPIEYHYLLEYFKDIKKKTYRILLKNKKKLELHLTFDVEKNIEETKQKLGIDFNYGKLSFYENENNQGNIEFDLEGNANKRQESLRKAIKLLLEKTQGDVVIEDLNFNRTKNKLNSSQCEYVKKYNKMLSNLPYSLYKKMMEVECFKANRFLKMVNPKYTSKIALEMGWDRHLGAARVIKELGEII